MPARWEPAERHGEDQHKQQPEHEARYGETSDGRHHHHPVDRAVTMQGRVDAGGNAKAELEEERRNCQFQRCRNTLRDKADGRLAVAHRNAEIAACDRRKIAQILLGEVAADQAIGAVVSYGRRLRSRRLGVTATEPIRTKSESSPFFP